MESPYVQSSVILKEHLEEPEASPTCHHQHHKKDDSLLKNFDSL